MFLSFPPVYLFYVLLLSNMVRLAAYTVNQMVLILRITELLFKMLSFCRLQILHRNNQTSSIPIYAVLEPRVVRHVLHEECEHFTVWYADYDRNHHFGYHSKS
jgi:hypothetical protein